MMPRLWMVGMAVIACLPGLWVDCVYAGGGPENVLLIANTDSEESLAIAHHYMQRRDVPRHQIVYVKLPKEQYDTCSFKTFDEAVRTPVKQWLERFPDNTVTILLLSRHVPCRVDKNDGGENNPALASTHVLALLPVENYEFYAGMRKNPYLDSDHCIDLRDPLAVNGEQFPLYCVGILNAFNTATAKRLVDDAIKAETKAPAGTAYLGKSKAGDPRGCYNSHFETEKEILAELGFTAEIVEFPDSSPKALLADKHDVLFYYFGQDSWDDQFPYKNKYLPGCVADNLTSFALHPNAFYGDRGHPQTSMCHFLEAGASATHGCVAEPFTAAFNPTHTHITRYLAGYNLIESYFMAHPLLPWMNIVVGDPLMQPFAKRPALTLQAFEKQEDGRWLLTVNGKATRADSAVDKYLFYKDGLRVAEQPGGDNAQCVFDAWDSELSSWAVTVVDNSKFKTQMRLASAPPASKIKKVSAELKSFNGKKAVFKLSATGALPAFSWYSQHATHTTGRDQSRALTLEFDNPAAPHHATIWILNAKDGEPAVFFFDLDKALEKK